MNFDAAFEKVVGLEGKFQRRYNDRGNWTGGEIGRGELKGTKYGISAAAYPHLDIENLTLDQAKRIYRADYWAVAGCEAVPEALRYDLFDFGVNSGPRRAAMRLQKVVGAKQDGIVGPRTLLAVGNMHPFEIRLRLLGERMRIMTSDPTFPANGRGWMNRLAHIALEV